MRSEHGHLCHTINIGQRGRAYMPYSEACVSMLIAGKYMDFAVVEGGKPGDRNPFIQLFVTAPETERFSQVFSSPITSGEGGLLPPGSMLFAAGFEGEW